MFSHRCVLFFYFNTGCLKIVSTRTRFFVDFKVMKLHTATEYAGIKPKRVKILNKSTLMPK
jgi:hypothetical protein